MTLVHVTGYSAPFTRIPFTPIGAVPASVIKFVLTVKSLPLLFVMAKFAATPLSWLIRNVRRWLNHVFNAVGAASGWPSHNVMPFATSDAYFASINASYFAVTKALLTALCTERK